MKKKLRLKKKKILKRGTEREEARLYKVKYKGNRCQVKLARRNISVNFSEEKLFLKL